MPGAVVSTVRDEKVVNKILTVSNWANENEESTMPE